MSRWPSDEERCRGRGGPGCSRVAVWVKVRQDLEDPRERTEQEKGWDSAVGCCAEYIRRRMNYDETLALELIKGFSTIKL